MEYNNKQIIEPERNLLLTANKTKTVDYINIHECQMEKPFTDFSINERISPSII